MTRHLVVLLVFLFTMISSASADPRFVLVLDKEQAAETLDEQIRQVLPQLWDRLLPIAGRGSAPFVKNPQSLLQRVQRGSQAITLEISKQAVAQLLLEQGIPMIAEMPRFRLNLTLTNVQGKEMTHSGRLLAQQAAELARRWGILLDPDAANVNMHFQWLDAHQVSLHIRGSALLSEVNENRRIRGDSFAFLTDWLQDSLLQLRDTLGSPAQQQSSSPVSMTVATDDPYGMAADAESTVNEAGVSDTAPLAPPVNGELLVLRKSMSLSQQLMFERAIQQEQRVKALIPMSFSDGEQRYVLQLKVADKSWLGGWFSEHGMQATRLEGAWLIQ